MDKKENEELQKIRAEIDIVDEELVELISKRSRLVATAASLRSSVDELKDDERVDFVVQRARKKAIKLEISPNMIAKLFTIMVNDMVEREISEFRNTQTF